MPEGQGSPLKCNPINVNLERQINVPYVLTEEEKRTFRECGRESFLYRSLPFSAVSMMVTQMLIQKGVLTTHTRFGSLPKVAFAGFIGYIGGKFSYVSKCQEKFKQLENSPLGEMLRKGRTVPHEYNSQQSGFSKVPSPSESAPASVAEPSWSSNYPADNYEMADLNSKYEPVPFSSSMNESSPTGITDSVPQESEPSSEEVPKKRGITYEELRRRNREMYEAGIMQKSGLPSKSSQGKVNKYGDAWEE
ncbi:OCIA domain-containing protein 1 isoform X5 [Varanus komodoensis]|uniref:OCIA domain-containing protein 1 isoform X5 n=1 Tax=Varanus komodoensis TaxID=61221 RepID=UPI001CF7998C|nr:OCIA domain-containing protein 1 isoform X5 [Varanus komodoensis]